ncbi:MAG: hypothetical protein ABIA37_00990 [Candidatus Woesearchaeota archaeon]
MDTETIGHIVGAACAAATVGMFYGTLCMNKWIVKKTEESPEQSPKKRTKRPSLMMEALGMEEKTSSDIENLYSAAEKKVDVFNQRYGNTSGASESINVSVTKESDLEKALARLGTELLSKGEVVRLKVIRNTDKVYLTAEYNPF